MNEEIIFGFQKPNVSYTERQAAYVVISDNGKFAAVKPQEKYFLPGGGSLSGETSEDTVVREVSEELARSVRLIRKIDEVIQYFYSAADDRYYKMRATFFVGEFIDESCGNSTGENELCWLSKAKAEQAFFHECHEWATRQIC